MTEINMKEIPRLQHIKELRKRMLWVVIPSLIIFILIFTQSGAIVNLLTDYYSIGIYSLSPSESIIARINIALAFASIFFIPLFIYQMIAFSQETLNSKTRKIIRTKTTTGIFLAFIGLILGLTIFSKIILGGLMQYNLGTAMWSISSVMKTIAIFGIAIAVSVQAIWFIPFIIKSELITKKSLKQARPFLIVGLLIISAIITPPDVISQALLMIPLYGSFEIGMLLTKSNKETKI